VLIQPDRLRLLRRFIELSLLVDEHLGPYFQMLEQRAHLLRNGPLLPLTQRAPVVIARPTMLAIRLADGDPVAAPLLLQDHVLLRTRIGSAHSSTLRLTFPSGGSCCASRRCTDSFRQ